MRDMRLSFWSSIYGCAALLCVFLSRTVSFFLQTAPERLPRFADPINYLLTLGAILLLLRATGTASASVKKLRTGKNLITGIQIILVIDLMYLIAAQILHFTMNTDIHNSPIVVAVATVISLPTVCGLYGLYFSKQLRSRMQYVACGFFCISVLWNLLRLSEKVILPLLEQHTDIEQQTLRVLYRIAGINDIVSIVMFAAAFIGLSVYAYYCGAAAKKMPEKEY